ncbi:MAG TPA: flagellar basal body L-ring protein FlgH [Rhodocyclaceae bacterium]|nr:flagellar basal body L-ring protein FlgH [Rhodocyclaceae bacterium]
MKAWLALCAMLLLAGCSTFPPTAPPVDDGVRLNLPPPAARKGTSGGVFSSEAAWSLTSDSRAFRPGDLLTVMLLETTQASKTADTKFGKSSSVGVTPSVVFGKPLPKTEVGIDASRDFSGNSSSTQQNTLQGAITVVVHEVLPNGLLRVNGEKSLYLNEGEEFVRLSGYVRAGDIDSDNRVSSQRVANARIAYSGRGAGHDANSAGWLTRFFTSPWMPF